MDLADFTKQNQCPFASKSRKTFKKLIISTSTPIESSASHSFNLDFEKGKIISGMLNNIQFFIQNAH